MYGLNPSITNSNNPNSPYYESPCDFCKCNSCEGCEYIDSDSDDDKMPEDEMFDPAAMNEMYAEQI